MSYKFKAKAANGDNIYSMTMKVYLDQWAVNTQSMIANLDNPAPIGVYLGASLFQTANSDVNGVIDVPLEVRTTIVNPSFPCLVPPGNILVTEGVYHWDVQLPVSDQSYTLEWQRCCRNVTISNINNPNASGATFSIEITPMAQKNGNSSPEFKTFPPTLICVGEPLNYDHSATDVDNDQIVYEFCAPLLGGGNDMSMHPQNCTSTSPNPPCPPPFSEVSYKVPNYSAFQPIHGLKIDPNTGLITGTPDLEGQFVVGVCAKEFRNGVLLSILKRDFQFNVVICKPDILAKIKADTTLNGKKFIIQACGQNNVTFENQSYDRANISNFRWEFNIKGTIKTYSDWSPTVTFPDTGTYHGQLLLNPGTKCGDTANITLNVFNQPTANFTFSYDTCIAGPVAFTDKSTSPAGVVNKWAWSFSDGATATLKNPSHLYQTIGSKNISLHIVDVKNCKADTTKSLNWSPAPQLLIIQPSLFNGCSPAKVFFNNLSKPIDSTYKIVWTFGDGSTGGDISPTHIYKNPGTYSVGVNITTPLGCSISGYYPEWIHVKQGATANFDFFPQVPTVFNSTVQFTDKSINVNQWNWFFGNKSASNAQNPSYTFRDTGTYKILLIAGNQYGCRDSIAKTIDFEPQVTYFLPNAFTPNDDGVNDAFKGTGIFSGIQAFRLQIWNRWGEKIFETNDPNMGWNGKKYNTGADSPQGVYFCVVNYTGPRGNTIEIKNYATLVW